MTDCPHLELRKLEETPLHPRPNDYRCTQCGEVFTAAERTPEVAYDSPPPQTPR